MKKKRLLKIYLCRDCALYIRHQTALYGKGRCKKCAEKCYVGTKNGNWRGGKVIRAGYTFIHSPHHPNCNANKYVQEHRLVMEKKLGRYLTKKEIIHHLNGIKNDNRPENLSLETKKTHKTLPYNHTQQLQKRIRELENVY